MGPDPRRLLRAAVLAIWTGLFAWLWIHGATVYIGPRTAWVVPFGTIALGACTAVVLGGALADRRGGVRPSLRELAGCAALLAPVVAVLVVESPQLGANAADRKASIEIPFDELAENESGALDLVAFVAASQDPEIARELGADQRGRRVAFGGIVTHRENSALEVTRFKIYCCAADAIPYTARLDDRRALGGEFEINDWVYVRGEVAKAADGTLTVIPDAVDAVEAPLDPYL